MDENGKKGVIAVNIIFSADELISAIVMSLDLSHLSEEEKLKRYKLLIDRTPDKLLNQHLDSAIKDEMYELAAYIRDVAKQRGVDIQ